jgi:hypothetical protein
MLLARLVDSREPTGGQTLRKNLEGASVLTVGETPGFLESGGAIAFLLEGDRLQFDINKSVADDVHLRISSNMLALARRVVVRTEAPKS